MDNRPIRSFVLRKGRLTPAQQRALELLWPQFGIDSAHTAIDFNALFGRRTEVVVEVGFGNGEACCQMARRETDKDFIGIEVHRPGVGRLLLALAAQDISNVRIACEDAVSFLQARITPGSLAAVRIYFPDPWPKKRHHKRRIIQPHFAGLLARCIKPGGIVHLATDWQPYANHMLDVLSANPDFSNLSASGDFCERPPWRPYTKYEKRGASLGHNVRDLLFERC